MQTFQSEYYSKIYREFSLIEPTDFNSIIRFFEERQHMIFTLEFEERFELMHNYAQSLFQTGAYRKHLNFVDRVLEAAIQKNIVLFKGKDLFRDNLFCKAASLYNLGNLDKADYVLRELVKIYPGDVESVRFLRRVLLKKPSRILQLSQGMAVLLVIIYILTFVAKLLFPVPYWANIFQVAQKIALISASGLVLLGWAMHKFVVEYETHKFVSGCKVKRRIQK